MGPCASKSDSANTVRGKLKPGSYK
jgi:calcium-dependent protein kinase